MTGRRAIIHIGLPKTGSTAIQGFLKDNTERLHAHGAHFANAPGRRNHAMLATFVLGEKARRGLQRRSAKLSSDPETFQSRLPALIEEELRQLPESIHTVIYSSEMLGYSVRGVEYAERLKALFEPLFADLRIVVYLRRQDEAAVSAYSTALKAGGKTRFTILPEAESLHRYQYHQVLEVFGAAFGDAALMPRIFDRGVLVGGDVVRDFLDACGLGALDVTPDSAKLIRGSAFRADVQEFLRRFNNLMEERKLSGRKSIASIVGDMPVRGQPRLPTRQEAQAFYAQFKESNEKVRASFFPDRPSLFSEDFSRYPDVDDRDAYSDTKVLDIAFEVLTRVAPHLARLDVDASFMQGRVAESGGRIEDAKDHYLRAAHSAIGHKKAAEALERLGIKAGNYASTDSDEDEEAPADAPAADAAAPSDDAAKPRRKRSKTDKQVRKQRRSEAAPKTTSKAERKSRRVAKKGGQ